MTNPFAQFATGTAAEAAPAEDNPFLAEAPASEPPPQMTVEEYDANVRSMVKGGKPVGEILKFSRANGFEVDARQLRDVVGGIRSGKYKGDVTFAYPNVPKPKGGKGPLSSIDIDPTVEPAKPIPGKTTAIGAFMRNLGQGITFDHIDEAAAGIAAPIMSLFNGKPVSENYLNEWRRHAETDRSDEYWHNTAQNAGYVGGTIAGTFVPVRWAGAAAKAGELGWKGRTAVNMGAGAGVGAAAAHGAATPEDRYSSMPTGAALGAAAGGVAEPLVRIGGATLSKAAERLGIAGYWNKISPEIKALAERINPTRRDIDRMEAEVRRLRDAGVEPVAADAMSSMEQDVIAAAARKGGRGRDTATDYARRKSTEAGSDVVAQFERVTGVKRTGETPDEMAAAIAEHRAANANRDFDTIREVKVPVSMEVAEVLATPAGRRAFKQAIDMEPDSAVRDAMEALPALIESVSRMSPKIAQQVLEQHGGFTLGMADKLRRALNDAAEGAPSGQRRVLRAHASAVRDATRKAEPKYAQFLKEYGEDSRTIDAIRLGEDFLARNTDEFVARARPLSDEENLVYTPEGGADDLAEDALIDQPDLGGGGAVAEDLGGALEPAVLDDIIDAYASGDVARLGEYAEVIDAHAEAINAEVARRGVRPGTPSATAVPEAPGGAWTEADDIALADDAERFLDVERRAGPRRQPVADEPPMRAERRVFPDRRTGEEAAPPRQPPPNAETVPKPAITATPAPRTDRPSAIPGMVETSAPSDRQLAVLAALRATERRVGEAPGMGLRTANAMAMQPEQIARSEALLGEDVARNLQEAMGGVERQIRTATAISPRTGSPTALRTGDDEALTSAVNFFGNAMSGKIGMLNQVRQMLQSAGMRQVDADALVERALDPAQTDAVIAELSRAVKDPQLAAQIIATIRSGASRSMGAEAARGSNTRPEGY